MPRTLTVGLALLLATASRVASQDVRRPEPMAFEAAAIKRAADSSAVPDGNFQPGGRITATNVTLINLIVAAYGLPSDRIDGGPAWTGRDRFDVTAVGNRTATVAETRQMLQRLLEDRFRLVARMEERQRPVFELVLSGARPGPKLTVTSAECVASRSSAEELPPGGPPDVVNPSCGTIAFGGGLLRGRGVSMAQVAVQLSNFAGRPVIDRTGLVSVHDFELRWSRPVPAGSDPPDPPEFVTAVREQLGLRLQAGQGPVRVLSIVSAEPPTVD